MCELLTLRHSLGYHDKTLGTLFASFDRYFFARARTDPWLTRGIVEAWVASKPHLKPAARAHRYSALRVLGRFVAQEHPQTYVPSPTPGLTSTFRPHIYTPAEIHALLDEAARLTPVGSLRPRTYVTLIGLLYCTGLRVSEALALRLADVDLDEDLLIIRHAKFHKSRAVPLQAGGRSVEVLASLTFTVEVDSGAAHCPQNLWPGGFSKAHFGHTAPSGAAHSPQKFMLG